MTKETNTTKPFQTSLPIPSRKDFHKEFAGLIQIADFNTYKPNPYRSNPHTAMEAKQFSLKKGGISHE